MANKFDIKKLYTDWYNNFIVNGGTPSVIFDVPFPREDGTWRVATDQENLIPKYGSKAINVVVPVGYNITFTNLGDNNVYYLTDYTVKSKGGFIPKYTDI